MRYMDMTDDELFAAWNEAMDTGNTRRALTIDNEMRARRWMRTAPIEDVNAKREREFVDAFRDAPADLKGVYVHISE